MVWRGARRLSLKRGPFVRRKEMEEERIVSDCEEDDTDESKLFLFRFEDYFLSSVLRLKGGTRGRGARRRVLVVVEFIREIRAEFHFALSRRATDAAGKGKEGEGD